MSRLSGAHDFGENVRGLCGPDEGFWIGIVVGDVVKDGGFQFWDAGEVAAPDAIFGEVAEESLHHVEPGRAGRREMHMEARMLEKLASNSVVPRFPPRSVPNDSAPATLELKAGKDIGYRGQQERTSSWMHYLRSCSSRAAGA